MPVWSLQRETIVLSRDGRWLSTLGEGDPATYPFLQVTARPCKWPEVDQLRETDTDLDAFLFWSRAPFAERAPDGSVLLRDARFYDPRARDRFTVALPEVECEPLP
jgi:inner membrane protein